MKKNFLMILFVFIYAFIFSGCNKDMENLEEGFIFDEQTFTAEWNKWKSRNIQNYSFTLAGELPYWNFTRAIPLHKYVVHIVVKNGVIHSYNYIGDTPYGNDGISILEPEFTSIPDMYEKILDRVECEKQWWKENEGRGIISTKLEIKYDTESHYVASYHPVSKWKPDWIVDSTDHAVFISDFKILDKE